MKIKTVTKKELARMALNPAFDRYMRLKNAQAALDMGISAQSVMAQVLAVLIEERQDAVHHGRPARISPSA